jgi:hypothetical protein
LNNTRETPTRGIEPRIIEWEPIVLTIRPCRILFISDH